MIHFPTFEEVKERFKGKTVAIVGSAPSCLDNEPGFIDSHDLVVRISNFKLTEGTGFRTDVFYSFFGVSIKTKKQDLHGTTLCMCKLPDSKIRSQWHVDNGKMAGVDWTYIYRRRKDWWFCDTYIPVHEKFMEYFNLLGGHQPSTGFACILDIVQFNCEIYLTGFDFFTSKIHNTNEPWAERNTGDPICHVPEREKQWVFNNAQRFTFDKKLQEWTD